MDFLKNVYRGKNGAIHYLVGILLVIIGYGIIGQIPLLTITGIQVNKGLVSPEDLNKFGETNDFSLLHISSNTGYFLMLCLFLFAALGMYFALKFHNKKRIDVITARDKFDWKRFFYAALIWFAFTLIAEVILYSFYPETYKLTFNASTFIPLLLMSLFLLPIQSSMEEIFFRGYLSQGIYLLSKNPWLSIVLPTLLFSAVHSANPEIEKFGFVPMMIYYISAGLFLAVLAYIDNGLELSLGIHAATNFFGATCVTYDGAVLQTDTIFKTNTVSPWTMIFTFWIAAAFFLILALKKYNWQLFNQNAKV